MSSIYKSRLFNFLNRQKIRFGNQWEITWRNLKFATETGVQILLYPVYLIAKTSMSVKNQLESDHQESGNKIKFFQANIPRENDLWFKNEDQSLANNLAKEKYSTNLTTKQQGNGTLTTRRQAELRKIAPVKFVQKILNWVKNGPVATKLNLFGEADVEPNSLSIQILITRAIAYFFGKKQHRVSGINQEVLPQDSSVESSTIKLSQVNFPVAIDTPVQKYQLNLFSKVNNWLEKIKSNIIAESDVMTELSEQENVGIKSLILRAIAHFFGYKHQKIASNTQKIIASSHSTHQNLSTMLPFSTIKIIPESKTFSVTLPFHLWNLKVINININPDKISDNTDILNNISTSKSQLTELEAATLNVCSGKILSIETITQEALPNIPLEFSSDFWEAEVITVGYVKNILERILEFLDKITWWIEKQLVKLWRFCTSLLIVN